jgi:dethiobiotin synthetase
VLQTRHPFLIVEGIGGLLVPLTARRTVADLIRPFNLPVLLVTRPALGTLNHTLLTLEALRRRRFSLAGLVVNSSEPPAADAQARLAERTNPRILRRFAPVLAELPFHAALRGRGAPDVSTLASWLVRHMGVARLRQLTGV